MNSEGGSDTYGTSNVTDAIKDGLKDAEKALKEELGLSDDQDWVITVIIAGGSCLYTSIICCMCQWYCRKSKETKHQREMRS